MSEWLDVGPDDLEPGENRIVQSGLRMVLLRRDAKGLHATDALCPHKFAALEDGSFGEGCVTCPQHEATFDLATGAPQEGEEWAGRLAVHPARVVDGRLEIQLTLS